MKRAEGGRVQKLRGDQRAATITFDRAPAAGVPGAGTVHHVAWASAIDSNTLPLRSMPSVQPDMDLVEDPSEHRPEVYRRFMAAPNPTTFFDDKIAEEYAAKRKEILSHL